MATTKVTFSVDDTTVALLEQTARRLHRPKSQIIREAVAEYAARSEMLSDAERGRMLSTFDTLVPRIPERPLSDVESELELVRSARRSAGRGGEP
jgi:predicted transcriptional regulator